MDTSWIATGQLSAYCDDCQLQDFVIELRESAYIVDRPTR